MLKEKVDKVIREVEERKDKNDRKRGACDGSKARAAERGLAAAAAAAVIPVTAGPWPPANCF